VKVLASSSPRRIADHDHPNGQGGDLRLGFGAPVPSEGYAPVPLRERRSRPRDHVHGGVYLLSSVLQSRKGNALHLRRAALRDTQRGDRRDPDKMARPNEEKVIQRPAASPRVTPKLVWMSARFFIEILSGETDSR
jgi:hypothetical protein